MKKSLATDLTQGNVLRQLIAFAIPIALANILQIVYTVVDTVIVGRFIGTDGIAGVSSASNIIMLCTNFSMGISGAGQVIIAQFQGKNDRDAVSRSIGTMFTFTMLVALVLTAVFLPLTRPLLRLIRTPEAAFSMAVSYAACSFAGLLFVFGYSAVGSMLRGMGDSRHPLLFIGIATVLNIILDLLFVGPLHMGTFGAALATIIGQGLSFLFSLGYLYRKRTAFGFDFRPASFRMDPAILKMFVRLGIPMALQYMAVNISVLYCASRINLYGVTVAAVTGIGDKLRTVIAIVSASVGTAAASMIGQNFGAGKLERVKRIYVLTFAILFVLCALIGGICLLFPVKVFSLFDINPEVLALAPRYMIAAFLTFMAFTLYQPFASLINGMGHASFAFVNGLIDGFVARIGLVWLFNTLLDMGYWGVWLGAALATYVCAIIGTVYFLSGRWRRRKPITET